MDQPRPLLIYFRLFKLALQFLQQINVENVQPVYSAGIRTRDLWNMSSITTRPGLPPSLIFLPRGPEFKKNDKYLIKSLIYFYFILAVPMWS